MQYSIALVSLLATYGNTAIVPVRRQANVPGHFLGNCNLALCAPTFEGGSPGISSCVAGIPAYEFTGGSVTNTGTAVQTNFDANQIGCIDRIVEQVIAQAGIHNNQLSVPCTGCLIIGTLMPNPNPVGAPSKPGSSGSAPATGGSSSAAGTAALINAASNVLGKVINQASGGNPGSGSVPTQNQSDDLTDSDLDLLTGGDDDGGY